MQKNKQRKNNIHRLNRILIAVFTAITQGILVAGLSTYVNQLIKQMGKDE